MASTDFYRDDEFDIYSDGWDDSYGQGVTGNDSGGFFSGISNWWKKVTGSGTTTAQKEANAYASREAELNRLWQSIEADINRRFQSKEAEIAYQRQVDFYNTYQSPSAMVQQYKDAGLNPALMAGGSVGQSSVPSSSSPSGSMPSSVSSPSGHVDSGDPSGVLRFVMDLLGFRSRLKLQDAETENIKANTDNVNERTKTESVSRDKLRQDINESFSREQFNYSSVDVNNSRISEIASNIRHLDASTEQKLAEVRVALDSLETAIANRKYLASQTSLNYEQINEIKGRIEYTAELLRGATQQNDFFDRVDDWRAKNEEMRAKNASVRERFIALGPALGITADRWSHWLSDSEMGSLGSMHAKKNLEKEMQYFLKFVENL